jgi:hypothetical protein
MAGEVYALSADLVQYVATYQPLRAYMIGKEDQRVAKWMRMHPNASMIHWVSERCQIYDHPKAGTTYSHGFLFPDEVERVKLEGRRGISEEERLKRGGELSQSYSTVSTWKKEYEVPVEGLAVDEQVEALIEGGGRWASQGWRSDNGRGPEAVRWDSVVFENDDERLSDARAVELGTQPDKDATGVKAGVPDRSITIPSARTTRFGKDLYRDPEDVEAVRKVVASKVKRGGEEWGEEIEVYNAVSAPVEETDHLTAEEKGAAASSASSSSEPKSSYIDPAVSSASSSSDDSSIASMSSDPSSSDSSFLESSYDSSQAPPSSSTTENVATSSFDEVPHNLPTGQIRLPAHNYILPPSTADRLVPPPTHRYDPATLSLRQQRMLGRAHGGTVAVHYLKYNEWFYETALALLGRDKMWDGGVDSAAFPSSGGEGAGVIEMGGDALEVSRLPAWTGTGSVERVDPFWGGARMYGSPIVRDNGYISEGRPAESRREVVQNVPNTALGGRFGRARTSPMIALALEDGVVASVGGRVEEQQAPILVQQGGPVL